MSLGIWSIKELDDSGWSSQEIAIKRNGVIYITAQNLSQKAIFFPMQFDIRVVWVGLMGRNVQGISLWNAHHQYLFSIH